MLGIIIPYRNREAHLSKFLHHMKKYLKDVDYEIFIIEQADDKPFNRGKLLNVGFSIAKDSCDYVCFHDVDMLPLKVDYSFPDLPMHLATAVEQFNFEMPYPTYFGGVTMFNIQDFESVNGYANEYWGWGAEDDDLQFRCKIAGLQTDSRKGFFSSLPHEKAIENDPLVLANQDKLEELLYGPSELPRDGLKTLKYTLVNTKSNEEVHTYKVLL